jgi:GAF domain-containing protein
MSRDAAGGRVLVVVPATADGLETADSRGEDDVPAGSEGGDSRNRDEDMGGDAADRGAPFLRGGKPVSDPEAGAGEEGEETEYSDENGPAKPSDRDGSTPGAGGSAGRPCDPEAVLAVLEEELDAEVVVRCGETATEYVSELGPTLDCVVVLGDDRQLIHDLIEEGSVTTIVCEPPVIGRIDDSVVGEDSTGELVERVRVELQNDLTRNDLRESNARLAALSHYAEDITACETVDAVVDRTLEATTDALAFDYCVVFLVEGERLVPRASALPEPGVNTADVTEGIAGRTLASGESEIVEDIQSDPDAIPEHGDLRGGLSVPIGERGVIQVASTDRDAFDERDREFVEILAGYTREALERIEREVTLRTERDRLHAFFGDLPVPAVHVERRDGVTAVREANRAYAGQFGEIEPGTRLSEVVRSETERRQYESALDTETVTTGTVDRTSGDDAAGEFALSVVPVSPPGTAECAYGIYIDQTVGLLDALSFRNACD